MKLLFIKKQYRPFGGAERYLERLVQAFVKKGIEVHLLTTNWASSREVKLHTVKPTTLLPSDLAFALKVKSFVKHFKGFLTFSFDRTISQDMYRASDGCHLRWLENRRKFLEPWWKGISFHLNPKHLVLKWLEKKCLEVSKVIVTNSQMVKNDFSEFYGKEVANKCKVVYNGIDLKTFSPCSEEEKLKLKKELKLPKVSPVFLFVGSGYLRKGLPFVLQAMKLIEKGILIVIGKDKNLKKFKELSKSMGIESKVLFLGAQREVLPFYRVCDVFVLPTIYDPFSNACLEAMACGKPVITTSANGFAEVVKKEKVGFLVNLPPDPEELLWAMKTALEKRHEIKNRCLITIPKFSIEKTLTELIEVIKSANSCN